jgi:O-antigen ligase
VTWVWLAIAMATAALVGAQSVYAPKLAAGTIGLIVVGVAAAALVRRYGAGRRFITAAIPTTMGIALVSANGVRLQESVTASDLFFSVGAVFLVLGLVRQPNLAPRVPLWLLAGAWLIVMSAVLVELWPPDLVRTPEARGGDPNIVMAGRLLLAIFVVPLLVAALCTTYARVKLLANIWVVGVAANCLLAVVMSFTGWDAGRFLGEFDDTYTLNTAERVVRYAGLAFHPNHLGLAAVLALPLVLSRVQHGVRYVVLAGLLGGGVLVTGSRGALVATLLAVAVVFVTQPAARRRISTMAAVLVLLALTQAPALGQFASVARLRGGSGSVVSNSERTELLHETMDLIWERGVLGYGYQLARVAHDVVLQFLVSGGALGLAGYLVIVIGAIVLARRLADDRELPGDARVLAGALGASIVVLVAAGLVQNTTIDRFVYMPLGLVVGLGLARSREQTAMEPSGVVASDTADRAEDLLEVSRADRAPSAGSATRVA